MFKQCLLVAAIAGVAMSVQVSQDDYARYIAQQQSNLEDKFVAEKPQPISRSPQIPAAYQSAAGPRQAYKPNLQAYQPQPQQYQAFAPQPSYQSPQAYQQPSVYQQPEQQYQPAGYTMPSAGQRAKAIIPKPKAQMRPMEETENDNDPNAQYQFSFDISDDDSTNYHNRKEQRDGQKISGSYSVVDSDGFIRTVTYTADPEEGFKAEVSREPTNIQVKIPTPAPQTAAPAPLYRKPAPQPPQLAQPQYYPAASAEQESEGEQAYYRPAPQQAGAAPGHRFAALKPLQAGSRAGGQGYSASPNSQQAYQTYQQ